MARALSHDSGFPPNIQAAQVANGNQIAQMRSWLRNFKRSSRSSLAAGIGKPVGRLLLRGVHTRCVWRAVNTLRMSALIWGSGETMDLWELPVKIIR